MELKELLTKALHNAEFLLGDLESARKLLDRDTSPTAWIAARKLQEHIDYVRKMAFDLAVVEG